MKTDQFDVMWAQGMLAFVTAYAVGLTLGAIIGFGWL